MAGMDFLVKERSETRSRIYCISIGVGRHWSAEPGLSVPAAPYQQMAISRERSKGLFLELT
jgi:hypothetical protein